MTVSLLGSFMSLTLGWLMGFLSLFLIMLILVQRGKGGGLTGALGGPGGQSAFGSKAGDTFTVITVVVASIWGFTCAFTMWLLGSHNTTAVTDTTTLSAGPGDENSETPPPIDPLSSSSGILDNLNLGGSADSISSGTPSADLVPVDVAPADSGSTTDAAAEGDGEGAGETESDASSDESSASAEEGSENADASTESTEPAPTGEGDESSDNN